MWNLKKFKGFEGFEGWISFLRFQPFISLAINQWVIFWRFRGEKSRVFLDTFHRSWSAIDARSTQNMMRRPPTKLDVQAVFFGSHIGTWISKKFTWILHKFIGFCWGICMVNPIVSSFGFSSSVLTCLRYDKLPKSGWILWSLSSHWGTTTAIPSLKAGAWLLRPRWWPFFQHQPTSKKFKYTTHFFRICRCWAPFFPLTLDMFQQFLRDEFRD